MDSGYFPFIGAKFSPISILEIGGRQQKPSSTSADAHMHPHFSRHSPIFTQIPGDFKKILPCFYSIC